MATSPCSPPGKCECAYAGQDPVTRKPFYLQENVPSGRQAQEAEKLKTRFLNMAAASPSAGGPAAHEGFVPARSSLALLTRSVGRGARTVRFVGGTNRDGSLVVRQLGWVPVTVTSARLITPALVAGDCTLT